MSAQEIIEQLKTMPEAERRTVVDFVQRSEKENGAVPAAKPKRDMKALIHEVFDEHDELFRKLAQ